MQRVEVEFQARGGDMPPLFYFKTINISIVKDKKLCQNNYVTIVEQPVVIGRKGKMTQKTKEMSPSEVLERIRKLQEKESDAYNQIQDVNDFFQGFLEEL